MHSIRMSEVDVMNKLVKQNIDVGKVIEGANKIKVNKDEIEKPPMTESTPSYLSYYSNAFHVVYTPLYDTTYILNNERTRLFTVPVGPTKSYTETNMLLRERLPDPNMFVVKGFKMLTNISKERLSKLIMTFIIISKIYAEMPLSHLPFEYPDNRIIIPSGANFHVEIQNKLEEEIKDKLVLVIFINGWMLRAVQ